MKQSKLSFLSVPGSQPNVVAPLRSSAPPALPKRSASPDVKPKLEPEESSIPPAKKSRTALELADIDQAQARTTLARLRHGYRDKSSGSGYPAALSNEAGCILAQKAPNREVSLRIETFQRVLRVC